MEWHPPKHLNYFYVRHIFQWTKTGIPSLLVWYLKATCSWYHTIHITWKNGDKTFAKALTIPWKNIYNFEKYKWYRIESSVHWASFGYTRLFDIPNVYVTVVKWL